jgi:phytoene dehydrogenase-like protein
MTDSRTDAPSSSSTSSGTGGEYDAIVIGAGHNGLTAAAVMARGGLRVLCLEKNQYTGGMASTTELIRGYEFEIAGSVLFPMPDEIYDDLGLDACPTYEAEVMSVNIGAPELAPMIFYSDPEQLMNHIADTNGMDAVMGMAEIMAWCDAPARALGRFDVRKPPKTLDEMFAVANTEAEREAIRITMFGSVMDVVDRFLPDKDRHAMLRGMLAFLAVNSTYRGPYTPGSALCLVWAMATTGSRMMRKLDGGIGALSKHVRGIFEDNGGVVRLHAKVDEILTDGGKVTGVRLTDGEVISAPVVVSNLDPTATLTRLIDPSGVPERLVERVGNIDHRAAYIQLHFALNGLPEFVGPYEVLNEGKLRASMGMFGSPEEMQRDYEDCCRGDVPAWPSMGMQIPSMYDPRLAPEGKHAASAFGFYFPIVGTHEEQSKLKDEMAERMVAKIAKMAPNFPSIIERQLTYPSYSFEMMFGCTDGDFCHGLIHPDLMGPFRPGPKGWPDAPLPFEGLYLSGAGCHGGPGVTFTPGYNAGYAVLDDVAGTR